MNSCSSSKMCLNFSISSSFFILMRDNNTFTEIFSTHCNPFLFQKIFFHRIELPAQHATNSHRLGALVRVSTLVSTLKISGGNGSMNRPIVKFQKDGDRRVDSVIGRPTFIGHVHPSRYLFFDLDTYRIMQYANEHLLSQPGCTNTGSGQLHAPITQTILTTPAFIDNHLRSSPS